MLEAMRKLKMRGFFENTIVISWIAPIITGVVVVIITSIVGKILSMWWKNRAFVRKVNGANEKYINNILPYMIQKIDLDREVLYSIKNAISLEYQIAMKHMYTNEQIRNQIILNISNTRFLTENNKAELIANVIRVFNEIGDSIEEETVTKRKKRIDKKYPIISMIAGLIFIAVIYGENPDKIDDPNSLVQLLIILAFIIIMTGLLIFWKLILDDMTDSMKSDMIDDGITGITNEAIRALGNVICEVFFGTKRKSKTKDDESDEK